ncbi:FkbM family methyltransferase [bacterium]|nr:FkbM family methyltransferase [bacterium]
MATEGSEWAQNALNDAILSTVIRRCLSSTSTALDVGAAHGRFAGEMSRVATDGYVLAIEPVPALNTYLRRIFRSKTNVVILPCAIGRENTQTNFWICDSNVGLSGLAVTNAARESGDMRLITVPVKTIDSIAADFKSIDLIKIDVEGGEYDVLLGAQETLSDHRPIVAFECTGHAEGYDTRPEETFRLFARLGYQLFTPTGYLRSSRSLSEQFFVECITGGHEFFFFAAHPGD